MVWYQCANAKLANIAGFLLILKSHYRDSFGGRIGDYGCPTISVCSIYVSVLAESSCFSPSAPEPALNLTLSGSEGNTYATPLSLLFLQQSKILWRKREIYTGPENKNSESWSSLTSEKTVCVYMCVRKSEISH